MRVPSILALSILFDIRDAALAYPLTPHRTARLRAAWCEGHRNRAAALLCAVRGGFPAWARYLVAGWTVLFGYSVAMLLVARAKPVRDPIYYALYVDGVMMLILMRVGRYDVLIPRPMPP